MTGLAIQLPPDALEHLAQRVAQILAESPKAEAPASPWLNVQEAAERLRCKPQRVYDLVSSSRLAPARDGSRLLFHVETLDAYLNAGAS